MEACITTLSHVRDNFEAYLKAYLLHSLRVLFLQESTGLYPVDFMPTYAEIEERLRRAKAKDEVAADDPQCAYKRYLLSRGEEFRWRSSLHCLTEPWLFEIDCGAWIDKAAHDLAALTWVTPLSVDMSLPGFSLIEPDDWELPKPLVWVAVANGMPMVATPYSYGPNLYAAWLAHREVLRNTPEAKRKMDVYWNADPQLLDE